MNKKDFSVIRSNMKEKTNQERLEALVEELPFNGIASAIVRERMIKMCEITRHAIAEDNRDFDSPLYNHLDFLAVCDLIEAYLDFDR